MSIPGIDISDFQSVDSFHAVQSGGYGFVYDKATEGLYSNQDDFADYRARTKSIGLPFGAYHYLTWSSDPVAQANHFLSVYAPANGDLPPMLDCEACAIGPDAAIEQVSKFLQTVEPHLGGHKMLLYMSYSFPGDHLQGGSGFSGHPLWVAAYNDDPFTSNIPQAWAGKSPGCLFWQYSDDLTVPGIPGGVDGDRFEGDAAELQALCLSGL